MSSQSGVTISELKIRKIMGRTYLNDNRLREAVHEFCAILNEYPDDIEALVTLGNLYLASGDGATARRLFRQALNNDPENALISQQAELAEAESEDWVGELLPTETNAINRLLDRLYAEKNGISKARMRKAAARLEEILQSPNPAEVVAQYLDEIDQMVPALLEINIRQAKEEGKPELVDSLRAMQSEMVAQVDLEPENHMEWTGLFGANFQGHVWLLTDESNHSQRIGLVKEALLGLGCQVTEAVNLNLSGSSKPDVAIASNPHTNPNVLESMAALSALKIPIIVDLDDDFEQMPVTHPRYAAAGLRTPLRSRAYTAALVMASLVTVPSEMQAWLLRQSGFPVAVLPMGWSKQNPLWEKNSNPRDMINIGWVGGTGQMEDLTMVRRSILRVMREFPHTQMVVIGDPQAYRLFDTLPDSRKMFLPELNINEHPYLLGQLDILLLPLRNAPYYQSLSDAPLVEAGIKGVPWIASPIPAFEAWGAGGLIAHDLDAWHAHLRMLIMSAEMRENLIRQGRQVALTREMGRVGELWLKAIGSILEPDLAINPTVRSYAEVALEEE